MWTLIITVVILSANNLPERVTVERVPDFTTETTCLVAANHWDVVAGETIYSSRTKVRTICVKR